MALTKDEVLLLLWALATGDGEECRIEDCPSDKLSDGVIGLIEDGNYRQACMEAIRETRIKVTADEIAAWIGELDFDKDVAHDMEAEQTDLWAPETWQPGSKMVDEVDYDFIIDEGMAPSWIEQIHQRWPNKPGPFYFYETEDPVVILVSDAPMSEDQRFAATHPEDWKM